MRASTAAAAAAAAVAARGGGGGGGGGGGLLFRSGWAAIRILDPPPLKSSFPTAPPLRASLVHWRRAIAYELMHPFGPSKSIAVCCVPKQRIRTASGPPPAFVSEQVEQEKEKDAQKEKDAAESADGTTSPSSSSSSSSTTTTPSLLRKEIADVRARAKALAGELGVPYFEHRTGDVSRQWEFLLEVGPALVQITQRPPKPSGSKRMAPVYVDFVTGALAHRAKFGRDRTSPMARAVGVGKDPNLSVLDATGGLGRDAFALACLGCRVKVVERNPVVHALLRDGLKRLFESDLPHYMKDNLALVHADSKDYLLSLPEEERPDVVYIDSMYPHPKRRQKALVKKGMQIARALVGDDADAIELLKIALKVARKHVVVKRPKYVSEDTEATRAYKSSNTRFEVHNPLHPPSSSST